jgi:hypothetical protein
MPGASSERKHISDPKSLKASSLKGFTASSRCVFYRGALARIIFTVFSSEKSFLKNKKSKDLL